MEWTKLIRPEKLEQLIKNHHQNLLLRGTRRERRYWPVVKLGIPATYCLWLLTECDEEGMAFGLCQIQMAELGSVWLPEMLDIDVGGLKVTEDVAFEPTMSLTDYADLARRKGGLLDV